MIRSLLRSVAAVRQLKKQAINLHKTIYNSSSEDFKQIILNFEREVDRLNALLISQFGEDPDIMQMTFELKAAVVALKSLR